MLKIFLTGSTGMVGMNILEHARASEYIFLKPARNELNLEDFESVDKYIHDNQPDIVVHAAGKVGGIQANIKEPVDFLLKNYDIGRNVIIASRKNNIKKLINLGSSCMYPRNCLNPIKEEFLLTGDLEPTNEGYALAKISVAKLCEYICKEDSNFKYKTVIPTNLYGKWDKFDPVNSHMIPAIIKKIDDAICSKLDHVEIWGTGNVRREFMYASDFADFIFYALDNFEKLPQYLNVGLGYDYSILEYYQTVANVLNFKSNFIFDISKPEGMKQKQVDITKLNIFGWKAKYTLEDGIKETYNYYKQFKKEENVKS